MKADVLALGAIIFVGGIGLAIWANDQAENMGLTRIVYTEEYDSYQQMAVLGMVAGAVGAGIALYGLASNPQQKVQNAWMPPQYQQQVWQPATAPPGQAMYCQYCGRPLALEAVYCPGCGRSTQK